MLESRGGRRVALFAHKPLFVDAPDEGDTGYWSVRLAQRRRLYDLIAAARRRPFRQRPSALDLEGQFNDIALVWAPPASFILDKMERPMPGERLIGAAVPLSGTALPPRSSPFPA